MHGYLFRKVNITKYEKTYPIKTFKLFYNLSLSMDSKYLEQVVSQTNSYYGALKPNTTNVLYVHGSIDPWHALGLIKSRNPKTPTIFINGKNNLLKKNKINNIILFCILKERHIALICMSQQRKIRHN